MRERRGRTSAFVMGSRFRRSLLTRATRIMFWLRWLVIHTARTKSAEFFCQPTVARLFRKFFIKTKTSVARTWCSIRRIQVSRTRRFGKRGRDLGRMARGMAPEAAFTNQQMAEGP